MTLVSPTRDSDAKQWSDNTSFSETGTFLTHQASTTASARGGGGVMFSGASSIPEGATIDDATWTITPHSTSYDTFKAIAYGHDSASPGVWADASEQDIWRRTVTTASTAVNDVDALGSGSTLDIDVTAIVQELVNISGWDSGNGKIVLLLLGNNVSDGAANARTTKTTATLAINYTPSADTATVTETVDLSWTVQTPAVASEPVEATITETVASGWAIQAHHVTAVEDGDTATPLVQLATRAPSDRQYPPVAAPYLFKPDVSQNKLTATPGASHDMQFTGSFRIEMDLVLGEYVPSANSLTVLYVNEPSFGESRISIAVSQNRSMRVVLRDTAHNGYSDDADNIFRDDVGIGSRVRFAIAWTSSTGALVVETGETSSDDLDATTWTTFDTLAIDGLTVLNTDQCEWHVGYGGHSDKNWKFIQLRVFDDDSGTNLISDVVAGDGADSKVVDRIPTLDWDYQGTTALHPYGDWEDISSSVRYQSGVKTKRGRSTDLGNMNAGSMSLTLDNLSRDFEPENTAGTYYPAIVPFTPIRLLASYVGTEFDLWRGFVRSWTPVYNNLDATTIVQCVDGFRPLNLKQTNDALTAAITDLTPVGFWPLTETSSVFSDDSANSNDLTLAGSATRGDAQVTTGDRRLTATFDAASDATKTSPGSELLLTTDFSFCASLNIDLTAPTNDEMILFSVGLNQNYTRVLVREGITWSGSYIAVFRTSAVEISTIYESDGSTATVAPFLADNKPHTIAGTFDASTGTLKYFVDGQLWVTTIGGATTDPVLTGAEFVVGGFNTGDAGQGDPFYGGLGFVAVWDRVLTDYEATTLTAPRVDGHAQGTPGVRIDDLLDLAQWPTNERDIEAGVTILVAKDATNTQVLAEIQTAETADIGEFFVAANGYATYRARGWRATNKPEAEAIFGDNTTSELPYTTLAYEYNETRIVNHWEATPADGDTGVAVDLTSIEQYGRRKQTETVDLLDGDAAQTYADNRLAARKDPDLIVRQLNIAVSRDNAHLLPVLLATEISDRYTIVRRPPGGGDPITNDAFVESISIECRSDTEWYFTLELSPLL